jgi:hypothetical protein
MRWFEKATRGARVEAESVGESVGEDSDERSIHAALRALPTLLDNSNLPNGVVELLIEDFEAPTRQLFDIHDGHVTLVEPGTCVPWACIAGPATAWTMALGQVRDASGLQLTGDEQLARRVLAALPRCEPD